MLTYTLRLISCIISGFYIDNTKFILQDLDNFVFQTTDKVEYLYTFGLTEVVHMHFLLDNHDKFVSTKCFQNFSYELFCENLHV